MTLSNAYFVPTCSNPSQGKLIAWLPKLSNLIALYVTAHSLVLGLQLRYPYVGSTNRTDNNISVNKLDSCMHEDNITCING